MLVECSYCEAKVDGKVLGEHVDVEDSTGLPFKVLLLECPACSNAMCAGQDLQPEVTETEQWDEPIRLWPHPKQPLDLRIPIPVLNSLGEAKDCYKAQAYFACAVMCRRALEGICSVFQARKGVLADRLKKLLDKQVIDRRIYDWTEALREYGNIGAHLTKTQISKEDAHDLLDFADSICDYVFVLRAKFDAFMDRKTKPKKG